MARNSSNPPTPDAKKGRIAQILEAYRMTAKVDRWVGLVLFGTFMAGWGAMVAIGALLGPALYFAILGVPVGALVAVIVFGRRVERAAYSQVEGQPGAAAAVLQNLRGWDVTPAVAANRNQDLVHRAVGRPGIVLVGEGDPVRVAQLLTNEHKRTARFVPDTPVLEVVAGDGPGAVPLRKLQRHLQKLPRTLRPAQVNEIRLRLTALGNLMDQMPIPKGPMPKGGRVPRPKRR